VGDGAAIPADQFECVFEFHTGSPVFVNSIMDSRSFRPAALTERYGIGN
jgi:hypothetical protein